MLNYAKCWSDHQRVLWCVIVFSVVVKICFSEQVIHRKHSLGAPAMGVRIYSASLIVTVKILFPSNVTFLTLDNGV